MLGRNLGHDIARENYDVDMSYDENFDIAFEVAIDSYRQYSPFEFFAQELNEADNSEELWESYDNGIADGIRSYLVNHYPEELEN